MSEVPVAEGLEYLEPYEGEDRATFLKRLAWEYLYARGGNKPEDVARWLTERTPAQFASALVEDWQLNEAEFLPITEDEIDLIEEVFVGGS